MTRGIGVLLTDNWLVRTQEYNGDMYLDNSSNGYYFAEALRNVNDFNSFHYAVNGFNQDFFGYSDFSLFRSALPSQLAFTQYSYISRWFSDFLFIRNATDKPYTIVDINNEALFLEKGITAIYYFGSFYGTVNDSEPPFCLNRKQKENYINNLQKI